MGKNSDKENTDEENSAEKIKSISNQSNAKNYVSI